MRVAIIKLDCRMTKKKKINKCDFIVFFFLPPLLFNRKQKNHSIKKQSKKRRQQCRKVGNEQAFIPLVRISIVTRSLGNQSDFRNYSTISCCSFFRARAYLYIYTYNEGARANCLMMWTAFCTCVDDRFDGT